MKIGDLVRYKDWYKGLIGRVIVAPPHMLAPVDIHWFDDTFSYLVKKGLLEVIK